MPVILHTDPGDHETGPCSYTRGICDNCGAKVDEAAGREGDPFECESCGERAKAKLAELLRFASEAGKVLEAIDKTKALAEANMRSVEKAIADLLHTSPAASEYAEEIQRNTQSANAAIMAALEELRYRD